jgi:hypothetical protein
VTHSGHAFRTGVVLCNGYGRSHREWWPSKMPRIDSEKAAGESGGRFGPADSERQPTAFELDWVHYWVQRLRFDRYLVDLTH